MVRGCRLRICNSKHRFRIILLVAVVVLAGMCPLAGAVSKGIPAPKSVPQRQLPAKAARPVSEAGKLIAEACEKITSGNFKNAREVLDGSDTREIKGIEQLRMILSEYESIEAKRKASGNEVYTKQIDELEKLQEKSRLQDANDINQVFLAIIKASDNIEESRKIALMESPFVKQTIEKALQHSRDYEARGEWINSYANCYSWLRALEPDNTEYKAHAEELIEKIKIELSLKDNSCDKSAERHEGIKPKMFLRAVKALYFNYVSIVDYGEMAKKALKQCELLGEVLAKSNEKLAYQTDARKVTEWLVGIETIQQELTGSFAVVTRDRFLKVFDEILALNSITIELPQEIVVARFSEASFSALDPYTSLVWPWQVMDFEKNMMQKFPGIGVQISKATGILKVVSLIPNTPAYSSGLDADDVILAVNGEPTDDMSIQCAVSKITGPKGTPVTLTIKHADTDETEDVVIVRDSIVVPTIRGWQRIKTGQWRYMIDPSNDIGYVRITNFTETTAPDMEIILNDLERRGLKGLVLDLRDNTGGYLSAAAAVADMFIGEGLIVKSQPRWGISTYEPAHKKGTHPEYPLVLLVNQHSASASEIVAGALQDAKYKRATLVGQRTYGKGSVQTITQFPGDGSQFKYTMAYYHLPSDQRVKNRYVMEKMGRKDWGIAPDVEVKLRTDEQRKVNEVHSANEVLARTDRNGASKSLKRYSQAETLDADPQLAIGVLVLKAKMIQAGRVLKFEETTGTSASAKLPVES